jgi:glycine betaine/choline ABC-type transport system substrate-binding protein
MFFIDVFPLHKLNYRISNKMAKTLEIRLSDLSDQAKELILAKAEEWQTSPEDAMSRLLDQLALESEKQSAA